MVSAFLIHNLTDESLVISSERNDLRLPTNVEEAKRLGNLLSRYRDRYFLTVLCGVLVTYVL